MNDTKVYTCVCKGVNKTPAVTHADYKALEEHRASVEFLLKLEREAHEATKEELAALRGRVGETK